MFTFSFFQKQQIYKLCISQCRARSWYICYFELLKYKIMVRLLSDKDTFKVLERGYIGYIFSLDYH